jgi:hypothetical protein
MTEITTITTGEELVQDTVQAPVVEEPVKKKRGRKPNPNKKKMYFSDVEEQAVRDYCASTDETERNLIFSRILYPAFTKMVESIIRRYKLVPPDEEFEETFNDTISFLMTKIELFNPDKGFKAYSYCGTICKNYLLHKLNSFNKIQSREGSFNDGFEPSPGYDSTSTVGEPQEEDFLTNLITNITDEIRRIIDEHPEPGLSHNEQIVGMALINLFENWEELEQELGSNKFNKSAILLYLKELTRLDTQTIRNSMRKYKTAYYGIKKLMLES